MVRARPRGRYRVLIMRPDIQIRWVYQIYRSVAAGSHRYENMNPESLAVISCIYIYFFFVLIFHMIFALILSAFTCPFLCTYKSFFSWCIDGVKVICLYLYMSLCFFDKLPHMRDTNTLKVEPIWHWLNERNLCDINSLFYLWLLILGWIDLYNSVYFSLKNKDAYKGRHRIIYKRRQPNYKGDNPWIDDNFKWQILLNYIKIVMDIYAHIYVRNGIGLDSIFGRGKSNINRQRSVEGENGKRRNVYNIQQRRRPIFA